MQSKPGGYRRPIKEQRRFSLIDKEEYNKWFQQFGQITGASTREHPAPFPLELAYRLVHMFSFIGDTFLNPFCGSGKTMVAAPKADRNGIGIEIDSDYCRIAASRLNSENATLFSRSEIIFHRILELDSKHPVIQEDSGEYLMSSRK